MERFRLVTKDDDPIEIKAEDMATLYKDAQELRKLINDPVALLRRAMALLEGTAEPLGKFF